MTRKKPVTSVESDWRPPLPRMPKTERIIVPDAVWIAPDGGPLPCQDAPEFERWCFAEADRAADADMAEALGETYCARCPLAEECIAFGRATRGYGVYGGYLLLEGRTLSERETARRASKTRLKNRAEQEHRKSA